MSSEFTKEQLKEIKKCVESLGNEFYEEFMDDYGFGKGLRLIDRLVLKGEVFDEFFEEHEKFIDHENYLMEWMRQGR